MCNIRRYNKSLLLKFLTVVFLLGSFLFSGLPVFAQTVDCAPGNAVSRIATSNILLGDSVVAPWSNETPVGLRSSETIDGRLAMRADMIEFAPIAFDSNGELSAQDFDAIEFRIRSSIDNPPVNMTGSGNVACALDKFVNLEKDSWILVQVPLASLGLVDQSSIGRLKIKSTIAAPFTLWITDVKLISATSDITPPATSPPPGQCIQRPTLAQFVPWHDDPGVRGEIDDHLPTRVVRLEANGEDQLDDDASFDAALGNITEGGILEIPAGTYYLSRPIELRHDNQLIRGAGSDQTHLVFRESLAYGIAMLGADNGIKTTINNAEYGSKSLLIDPIQRSVIGKYGTLLNTSSKHMQVVSIIGQRSSANQTELLLSSPLNSDFDFGADIEIFDAIEFSGIEALSLNVTGMDTDIGDMIYMEAAAHTWVREVKSQFAWQAHVFTRETYACEITGSTFLNATDYGDGKRGYGIDLANSTTGCLVENNTLGFLRHSILLNIGASGNVVAFNHSFSPRHPNFFEGGPGDISFHNFAWANLVEGNVVERIHVGDSDELGGGNLIHRNCLTSGPLTVGHSANAVQSLYANAMYGSNAELAARFMPPVLPMLPEGRPYLSPGETGFVNDGIRVVPISLEPSRMNNWFEGEQTTIAAETQNSYYGARFSPLVKQPQTDNWRADCQIPAYLNAEGL